MNQMKPKGNDSTSAAVEQHVKEPQLQNVLPGKAHRMDGTRQVLQDVKLPFAALHHPQRRQYILSGIPRLSAPAACWHNVLCCSSI